MRCNASLRNALAARSKLALLPPVLLRGGSQGCTSGTQPRATRSRGSRQAFKENTFPGPETCTDRGEMQILPALPRSHAFSLPPPAQHPRAECGGGMRQAGTCFPSTRRAAAGLNSPRPSPCQHGLP